MWMIRAGERGAAIDRFLSASRIAIGGAQPDADCETMSHDELVAAFAGSHPGTRRQTLSKWAREVVLFRDTIAIADPVLTYRPHTRSYILGQALSPARHDPAFLRDHRAWGLVRAVSWEGSVLRDALPTDMRRVLDRRSTLHAVTDDTARIIGRMARPLP